MGMDEPLQMTWIRDECTGGEVTVRGSQGFHFALQRLEAENHLRARIEGHTLSTVNWLTETDMRVP